MTAVANCWPATLQSAATGTGAGTVMQVGGLACVTLQVTTAAGMSATITPQINLDGSTFVNVKAVNRATGAVVSTITAEGIYDIPLGNAQQLQANITAFTSGTITVIGLGSDKVPAWLMLAQQSTGTIGLIGQGTAAVASGYWPTRGTDGTNLMPAGDATARPLFVSTNGIVNLSANFTRPADTTAYTSGDLVANSTTPGSVVPLSFTLMRVAAGSAKIKRARLKRSQASVTNASFRLHLYGADPSAASGIANGDNGAWSTKEATYLGYINFIATYAMLFTDGSTGPGSFEGNSGGVPWDLSIALASGQTIYGLLAASAAYTPASAEVFTVILEVEQL